MKIDGTCNWAGNFASKRWIAIQGTVKMMKSPVETPIKPPMVVCTTASMRNCMVMSRRACTPKGTANTDFAGALRYRRQHDVHDADAAHDQRDESDHAEQHQIAVLGTFGLFQAVEGYGQLRVLFLVPVQNVLDGLAGGAHLIGFGHGERHLAVFDLFKHTR